MPSAHCTVRVNSMCLHDLKALAAKENRSIGNMIEMLVKRAKNDPDGYFLRMAAMQSYIAAMTSLNLMARFVDGRTDTHRQGRRYPGSPSLWRDAQAPGGGARSKK